MSSALSHIFAGLKRTWEQKIVSRTYDRLNDLNHHWSDDPPSLPAPTMTGTGVGGNRYGTPDVVQQPQIGIAPQGFAASVQQGAPLNLGRRQ